MTRICLPTVSYHGKCCNFSLSLQLYMTKFILCPGRAGPVFRHDPVFGMYIGNDGLFVPLHFRSRERKVHGKNFRSRGTFVPWNIRSLELSLLWNVRSLRSNIPRTFAPKVRKITLKSATINLTIAYV